MTGPDWLARVRRAMRGWRGSGVVVAVSGGGDSVGLLRALHGSGLDLRLSVAHLDHGVRGEEGREDARFVAELADRLGLPFELGHWQPTRAGHFEGDARRARYAWLAEVARSRGAAAVAVGQTADDQAETILHRIIRGTGVEGLAGMPRRRNLAPGVDLVRPLLGATRLQVREYLAAIGQAFREDSTNADTSRTRSRIRLDLLPRLAEEYNPNVAEALVRLGRLAARSRHLADRLVERRAGRVVVEANGSRLSFDRARWEGIGRPARVEVIRWAWKQAGWPEGEMDGRRWRRLANPRGPRSSITAGIEMHVKADRVELIREDPAESGIAPVPLDIPGRATWGRWRLLATLNDLDDRGESVDLDRVIPPLVVRQAEAGDRFDPLGMGGRTLALADFFRGRRVPRDARHDVPVVRDAAGIIWVAGHRIGHRVRLTDSTRRVLHLRLEPGGPG